MPTPLAVFSRPVVETVAAARADVARAVGGVLIPVRIPGTARVRTRTAA